MNGAGRYMGSHARSARRLAAGALAASAVITALAFAGPSSASATSMRRGANLGPLTGDLESHALLGSFRHVGAVLTYNHRPELLFISEEWSSQSAAMKWAIVKALDQFGDWSGLMPTTDNVILPGGAPPFGPHPTYDWSHAIFRSRYISIVHRDLASHVQSLSYREKVLFAKYGGAELAFTLVAGYASSDPDVYSSDFEDSTGHGLPFAVVADAIRTHDVSAHYSLVHDVDAEANVIAALICHVDGRQPAAICGRTVIRKLLKSVK